MNDDERPTPLPLELEYMLRNMKNSPVRPTPTYSDTQGMGNVAPWGISRLPFPATTMEDWGVQRSLKTNPGTQGQRFDLERWLMEMAIKRAQENDRNRQPRYQMPQGNQQWSGDRFIQQNQGGMLPNGEYQPAYPLMGPLNGKNRM